MAPPSNSDVRNLASINGTWELPFGRGRTLLNNASSWQQALGRNTLTGAGVAQLDFSALKMDLTERPHAQFRAEFFNILNHANFGIPNTVVYTAATGGASPTAGVISSTSTTSRQIPFGLKLLW